MEDFTMRMESIWEPFGTNQMDPLLHIHGLIGIGEQPTSGM